MAERLSMQTLDALAPGVERFAYDRADLAIGVAHLGPGAFHRAHQAWYFDRLLEIDPRWAISGIAPKSATVPDALAPQDGLYALAELEAVTRVRVIGAVTEVLAAPREPQRVLARLAAPATRWLGLTVTEKGYGLSPSGDLDAGNVDVAADLAPGGGQAPRSAIGWIVEGLARRRAAGLAPFVVASCDNLPDNGAKLRRGVLQMAAARGADLAAWIEGEVRFPSSMVDSITPAADDALRALVENRMGLVDAAPVQREGFTQWVLEDGLGPDGPDLGAVGVTLTSDVAGYEAAKLRLLNGAHSSLAYLGLGRGLETMAEAAADPELGAFVRDLMIIDIAPTVTAPRGMDVGGYIEAILKRFRNPAIRHRLAQIAMDGSQKLPIRLLATTQAALDAGRPVERLGRAVAAWLAFVAHETAAGRALQDPMAERLAGVVRERGAMALLDLREMFPARLAEDPRFRTAVAAGLEA
ncbi:mannitol dehydrogenase family protein [Caulobacter sp. KR2-114]|uniref:mannitol dehydrogenase family protein n=1 Tax=Caulobacter sp. KR2-114 TaxID=3400912 RepID=UPI003BFA7CA6